jgi:hypothetical protein
MIEATLFLEVLWVDPRAWLREAGVVKSSPCMDIAVIRFLLTETIVFRAPERGRHHIARWRKPRWTKRTTDCPKPPKGGDII